ncbi:MAG TPA: hypothetical protein VGF77_08495 [Allosphingosinicella sp.]|jgi:hypothetical protein
MAFTGDAITVTVLAKFELPTATIRLCDGGAVTWGSDAYAAEDPVFGTIQSAAVPDETISDQAPGARLTFIPHSDAAAIDLSQPIFQNSRVRFWFAEVARATGAVTGTPEQLADMRLDMTTLRVAKGSRLLDMDLITTADRLMNIEDGNVLSPRFHKKVWPGETGLDTMTGATTTKAWGVQAPPRGTVAVGGSAIGGGTGYSLNPGFKIAGFAG